MLYLALVMVSSPILIMIFYMFYKSYLYFTQGKKEEQFHLNNTFAPANKIQSYPVQTHEKISQVRDDEDEITAVITCAVNYYLQKT